MVNKRGVLKIVEATIAVMIILTGIVFLSAHRNFSENRDLSKEIPPLLEELARNLSFREEFAKKGSNVKGDIEAFLVERVNNPTLEIKVNVCNLTEVCFLEPYPDIEGEVFSSERVISGSIKNESFEPKKVKVFLWRLS